MAASRRIVVTGLGLVTPVGLDTASFRASLHAGDSGVRTLRNFDASALPVRIGAATEGFDAKQYLDKKERKTLKMMALTVQFAVAAARLALTEAKLDTQALDPLRFGVVMGTGTVPGELADLGEAARASWDESRRCIDFQRWGSVGMAQLPPMWMLNHVPNMPACHVSILNNAQGPNNTVTQSDAASLFALGEATRVLQRGAADVMLAGGADARVNPISLARYSLFSHLSHRNDEPERACRPFDVDRDGQVLGEGAGVMLLETLEHAQRRGAPIVAEVLGFAAGFDRGCKGPILTRIINNALRDAGIQPNQVDHVNAHALGLRGLDTWEARGIHGVFGMDTPVLAVKGQMGNLGAGAAASEIAASLIGLQDGIVPATVNCDNPDPQCPVSVLREPRPARRPCIVKISATERGQCAVLVLRRWHSA